MHMKSSSMTLFVVLVLLSSMTVLVGGAVTNQYCNYTFPNGHKYNLQDAWEPTDYGPVTDGSDMGNTYFLSPCHNSVTCSTSNVPGTLCQIDGILVKHSCGLVSSGMWEELTSGVKITYTGGQESRSSVITYQCDPSQKGKLVSVAEVARLQYAATFVTKYACRGGGGGGGGGSEFDKGWIFVILFLCAIVIYLVGGALLLKYKYGAEGTQMIPNLEFWQSVPGLVRDGAVFAYYKITCQSGTTGGYQRV